MSALHFTKGGETQVLSLNTGYQRDYSRSPNVSYDHDSAIYFSVNARSAHYHPKEPVIGFELNGKFKAYPFAELAKVESPLKDRFGGQDLIVVFDAATHSGEVLDSTSQSRQPGLVSYPPFRTSHCYSSTR